MINKIDRSDARIEYVVNAVYDLFIDLDATDEQIEFKIIYTNAKEGIAHHELEDGSNDLVPLFDTIINKIDHENKAFCNISTSGSTVLILCLVMTLCSSKY